MGGGGDQRCADGLRWRCRFVRIHHPSEAPSFVFEDVRSEHDGKKTGEGRGVHPCVLTGVEFACRNGRERTNLTRGRTRQRQSRQCSKKMLRWREVAAHALEANRSPRNLLRLRLRIRLRLRLLHLRKTRAQLRTPHHPVPEMQLTLKTASSQQSWSGSCWMTF